MVVELISVGTEILMGNILNSNTQYLAEKCALLGLDQYYQVTVGDNYGRMMENVKRALDRSDIVILTGGLGPTEDDMTKEEILAEMPEIAVTEQDEKLEDYVMGLPEVQELLAQPDGGSIPNEKEETLLSDFLAEGDLLTGFGVVDHDVYLDIKQGEEKQLSYTFDGAGTQPMRKIIWVYEQRWDGWQNTAAYEAWGDSYVKRTGKHAWFSWVGGLFR